ncbi:UNVERIFIED_CONTAM: hypothetical protein Sindi_1966100 [Sesamum indicum]
MFGECSAEDLAIGQKILLLTSSRLCSSSSGAKDNSRLLRGEGGGEFSSSCTTNWAMGCAAARVDASQIRASKTFCQLDHQFLRQSFRRECSPGGRGRRLSMWLGDLPIEGYLFMG